MELSSKGFSDTICNDMNTLNAKYKNVRINKKQLMKGIVLKVAFL